MNLFRKRNADLELDSELRFHVDEQIAAHIASGLAPEEARRRALLEFGGLQQTKESVRDTKWFAALENLFRDIRFCLRQLRKNPGFTIVIVVTLALGMGVNTAIFSVLNGWLLRPLPVQAPEQIVVVASQQRDRTDSQFSYRELVDFRNQANAFSSLFAYALGVGGLSADGNAGEFAYSSVTGNYFSALGVKPALGRLFLEDEGEKPGDELSVILGYNYWQKRFGGDRGIVGKQIRINGKAASIIGVVPQEFHGTLFAFDMDGFLPLNTISQDKDSATFWTDRNVRPLNVLGRLRPGVSVAQAQSSVEVIAKRLAAQYPESDHGVSARVIPERLARPAPLVSNFVPAVASLFLLLAGLVLLLACVNVANILLARATTRVQEMAIRAALGGHRGRLIRQMLVETLLLAFLGACAGVVLGEWAMSAAGSFLHSATSTTNFAYRLDYSFDWRVFAYTLGSALFAAVLVGVWPAFRVSRTELYSVLHEGRSISMGSSRHRIRRILVVAQVAGSLTLLVVAGLFVRSLRHAENMYLGFDPKRVLNVMLDPHQIGYDQAQTKAFYRELKDRASTVPGVELVSLSYVVPLQYPGHAGPIYAENNSLDAGVRPPTISFNSIDADYFDVMRIPLLRGRKFSEFDSESARPIAIVNNTMAQKFWPNENAIGKRFSLGSCTGPFIEVVGIAGDGQYFFLSPEPQPYFYVPLSQNYSSFQSLQVRSSIPPERLNTQIQGLIRTIAPDLPTIDVSSMDHIVQGLAGSFVFRLAASLAAIMGVLGLSLALVGVYGVVSFMISQRARDIGIRMALGASQSQVLKPILVQGIMLTIIGVMSGLILALLLAHAIAKLLIGVSSADPITYFAVALLLSLVSLLACYLPARRATRVDPVVALRYE